MRRLLGFTISAGALVGTATGAVFTPFGIPPGALLGAVLGVLAGCCSAGLLRAEGPGFTLPAARLLLTAPPLILLVLAGAAAGVVVGAALAGISVAVAGPLSAVVTYRSAPWIVAPARPDLADEFARPAMLRAVMIPVWFLVIAVTGWVVTFVFLTLR
jgi:hypothetical protein